MEINEKKATSPGSIRKEYAETRDVWLKARTDWDTYRKAVDSSDPRLKRLDQFAIQLIDLLPPHAIVADLGFGPEGRDVAFINTELGKKKDIKAVGIELVTENIHSALAQQRAKGEAEAIEGRLVKANIETIPLANDSVDGVILSSVIQHIEPKVFYNNVVPDIHRSLKNEGMLFLIFKATKGLTRLKSLQDKMMNGRSRKLYFYNPDEVINKFSANGFNLYEGDDVHFGGEINLERSS